MGKRGTVLSHDWLTMMDDISWTAATLSSIKIQPAPRRGFILFLWQKQTKLQTEFSFLFLSSSTNDQPTSTKHLNSPSVHHCFRIRKNKRVLFCLLVPLSHNSVLQSTPLLYLETGVFCFLSTVVSVQVGMLCRPEVTVADSYLFSE